MQPTRSYSGHSKPPGLRRAVRRVAAVAVVSLLALGASCGKQSNNNTTGTSKSGKKSSAVVNQKFTASVPPELVLPDEADEVGMRVLRDYGSMFVARAGAAAPPVIVFADDAAVREWQAGVRTTRAEIGGISVELQAPAMTALMEARTEAQAAKLDITPRGTDAARRSYEETVKLWQSRVNPGLTHWANEGRLDKQEAARIRQLPPREQIPEILRLEADGLYFSTDFKKSILYSVAAPGTSQHLSMLAFDVKENENAQVRSILARHGWFQTITSDTPHFTFLGVKEDELPSLGLKRVTNGGRVFWIPDL
jgi:D-alanyl-D-alanine carboxypeptidase